MVIFSDWANALDRVGHPLQAEKLFRRAIDISRAGQSEESVPPMLLTNYARTLRQLHRFDEATDYAERAYAKGKKEGSQIAMTYSLNNRAAIYLDAGKFAPQPR